jgi:menaquinone-9 beta-reductase
VLTGTQTRAQGVRRYGAFSDAHARKYSWLLTAQRAIGQLTPSRSITALARALESRRMAGWLFDHYLAIAPPSFVGSGEPSGARPPLAAATL